MVLAMVMRGVFDGQAHVRIGGDAIHYLRMAQEPFSAVPQPYASRLLSPMMARSIHGLGAERWGWDASWVSLTFAALFLAAVTIRRFLAATLRLDGWTATALVLCLVFNYCWSLFLFEDPFLPDPLNNLFWALAIAALFSDRFKTFLALLVIGSLNKEVILLLTPLYPVLMLARYGSLRHRAFVTSLLGALGVLLLYVGYRLILVRWLHPVEIVGGPIPGRSPADLLMTAVQYHQKDLVFSYRTFHFLWVLFVFALYELHRRGGWRNRYLLGSVTLLAMLLTARLFATDADRVLVMAAPLICGLTAALTAARQQPGDYRLPILLLLASMALQIGWVAETSWQTVLDLVVVLFFVAGRRTLGLDQLSPATLGELDRR